jgi:hypothetical protein
MNEHNQPTNVISSTTTIATCDSFTIHSSLITAGEEAENNGKTITKTTTLTMENHHESLKASENVGGSKAVKRAPLVSGSATFKPNCKYTSEFVGRTQTKLCAWEQQQ